MRYLGNKDALSKEIVDLLQEKDLLKSDYVFFDAFCGTGAVANSVKSYYKKIVINDNLYWATTYTQGRIYSGNDCTYELIKRLNNYYFEQIGFIYENYSYGPSKRMYFTKENALKIDSYRLAIEKMKTDNMISKEQYNYLLYRLIESVSDVSNTAGVYGAFLKKWDSRALKEFNLYDYHNKESFDGTLEVYNDFIEDIISKIECDVLYLDPPYTQNQYGTQYHLLETLILNDKPTLSEITGSRPTSPMRSKWSKEFRAHIALDHVLANTKAKHVIMSYNNDGIMSKKYIESVLKRYGIEDTYQCKKIKYKKYENWKSDNEDEHFEFLFYIALKDKKDVIYESPLNYTGNKYRMCDSIKKYIPPCDMFYDVFGGGFTVGANSLQNDVIYNDINYNVVDMVKTFYYEDTYDLICKVKRIIKEFGLQPNLAENYIKLRKEYNSLKNSKKKTYMLFALIMYGFQQQIRFNSAMEFNNPIGMRWFNDSILEKTISFSRHIKEKNVLFYSEDYINLDFEIDDCFFYFDPPYRLTLGSYNDGKRGFKGWTLFDENLLLEKLNCINNQNKKFMLSYVIEHNGNINENIKQWVINNNYRIIEIQPVLGVSGSRRKEVLIVNYEW